MELWYCLELNRKCLDVLHIFKYASSISKLAALIFKGIRTDVSHCPGMYTMFSNSIFDRSLLAWIFVSLTSRADWKRLGLHRGPASLAPGGGSGGRLRSLWGGRAGLSVTLHSHPALISPRAQPPTMVGHLGQIALVFKNNRTWKPRRMTETWPWQCVKAAFFFKPRFLVIQELDSFFFFFFAELPISTSLFFQVSVFEVSICQHTPASDVCTSLILIELALNTRTRLRLRAHSLLLVFLPCFHTLDSRGWV